jgi:hypothetical protein
MARSPRPKSFQIPEPGHQPLKVSFCGSDYTFSMKTRFRADELRAMARIAFLKMPEVVRNSCINMSFQVASMESIPSDDQEIVSVFGERNLAFLVLGVQASVVDVFEFICHALELTPKERRYAEENYDLDEMTRIFIVILGAVNRPFGGTLNASQTAATNKTTDSTDGESATQ